MKTRNIAALFFAMMCIGLNVRSEVMSYWRFEEGPPEFDVQRGGLPDGVFYPAIADSSGHSNELSAWSFGGYAGHYYALDVASPTVTQTGETNTLSVQNTGCCPAMFTSPFAAINTITPGAWTIEASFKPEVGGFRTIVGRDSYGASDIDPNVSALYFQIVPGDAVSIKFGDVSGYWHEATSGPGLIKGFNWPDTSSGHWYHMAAVCDGRWLLLYLNDVDAGGGYQLVAAQDLSLSGSPDTRMTAGLGSGFDWVAGTWSVGRGLYGGGHTDRAWGLIDEVRISDDAKTPDQFLYGEEQPPFAAEPFRILDLKTNNSLVVDHNALTGDDRGGIAVSSSQVFYSGDNSTARFQASDLGGGTALGEIRDAMVSDLKTETVYSLGTGSEPIGPGGGVVTSLLEMDSETGAFTGGQIDLSAPIFMGYGSGIFAGYGQIVLYSSGLWFSDNLAYSVELPSGRVRSLGPLTIPEYSQTENWAFWGVAESIAGSTFITYVQNFRTIARTRVSDGLTVPIHEFSSLSDMACFTVSLSLGRWYFHYEGSGQFGGFSETLGYADASFDTSTSSGPAFLAEPQSIVSVEGQSVTFSALSIGDPPPSYQWRKDGADIPGATNTSYTISSVLLSDAGAYSVMVSNSQGTATSAEALLSVFAIADAMAVFDDSRFVDTFGSTSSESDNVQASLQSLGLPVVTFTNLSDATATFARIFIPELERGNLSQSLTPTERSALSNYVQQGGALIVFGDSAGNSARLLNDVLGYELVRNNQSFVQGSKTLGVYGTEFTDDPDTILYNNGTYTLSANSMPPGGRILYQSGQQVAAALFEVGDGVVIFLAWDWFDAAPRGSQENGWNSLLESAASQPTPLPPTPPLIVQQPQGKFLLTGSVLTLKVNAIGTQPLFYQWSRDGSDIPGATNAIYTIASAQPSDAGSYLATVSNALDSVSSDVALIRVGEIAILSELMDQSTLALGPTVFSVLAIGTTDELFYQWFKDGELIVGATNDFLELPSTHFSDAGGYSVMVSNLNGVVVESGAELTVLQPKGGDVDFSFNPGSSFVGNISDLAVQPDGKLILAGGFSSIAGAARPGLARLRPDGSLDHAFMNGLAGPDGGIDSILVQADGQILVGGSFLSFNGEPHRSIVRLNRDGSLDDSFGNPLATLANAFVYCMAQQPDGKLLMGGYFSSPNSGPAGLLRLNEDGTLDESFQSQTIGTSVFSIAVQADGKVLIAGTFSQVDGQQRNRIARLHSDGSLDESFQNGMAGVSTGYLYSLALQPDGKVLIGGYFQSVNNGARGGIARLNEDGSLDDGFQDLMTGVDFGTIQTMAYQPDGDILIGGNFETVNGVPRYGIARLNPNGSLDDGFQDNLGGVEYGSVNAMALLPENRVLIGGFIYVVNGQPQNGFAVLTSDGSLDTEFNKFSGIDSGVIASALQPDGKLLIGGWFTSVGGLTRNGIARLNEDGSVDESFLDGLSGLGFGQAGAIALQQDGKVLIGGYFETVNDVPRYGIARLNHDGSLDESFQNGMSGVDFGFVDSIAVQPDGKILIGGYFENVNGIPRFGIARLNTDGSLDGAFQDGMSGVTFGQVSAIALQPTGEILIGGYFETVNDVLRNGIARLLPNGALDSSFQDGMSGTDYSTVQTIAVQGDGQILIGGDFTQVNGAPSTAIARLNPNGSLDGTFLSTFAPPFFFYQSVQSIAIQPDGRIVVGGYFQEIGGETRNGIARLLSDGSLDTSFQHEMDGVDFGFVFDVALAPDGKVLINGDFALINGEAIANVARLWGGPPTPIVITAQPQDFLVQQGETAMMEVVVTGEPTLHYQWLKGQNELVDQTNATLTIINAQESDEGFYSARVINPFEMVLSSNAFLTVNQPPVANASATIPVIISANGLNATAILDGSRSFDPDGDTLEYAWLEAGSTNVLAQGMIATPVLSIGTHTIVLVVSDGGQMDTDEVTVEIISTSTAVSRLQELVAANAPQPQSFLAKLKAALASITRDNSVSAVNQLIAFQNQVRAQFLASDPTLAGLLLQSSQEILNALTGGNTNPGGQPHGKLAAGTQQSGAAMSLQIDGQPWTIYVVEASTDLLDWQLIGVMVSDENGKGSFEDPDAKKVGARFYRTRLP